MSRKTTKYNPYFPEMQSVFVGRKNISAKETIRRKIEALKTQQLWEFRQLFANWIPSHLLRPSNGQANSRNRIFSLELVFWAFLNQIFMQGTSCSETVKKIQSWMLFKRRKLPSSSTSAYCQARKRLPVKLLQTIHQHIISVATSQKNYKGLWKNREVKVVDGTGLSMSDTSKNQKHYPQSTMMKAGCGFPQIKLTAVFSLASGTLLGYAFGDLKQSENTLWKKLWSLLKPGDIALGDRGFGSYANIAALLHKGVDSVMRLHQGREKIVNFKQGKKLGKNDCIITWKRPGTRSKNWSLFKWNKLPETLKIRIIEAPILRKGFRSQKILISTTLLDSEKYSAIEIAQLYFKRWQIEVFFRDIKTTMGMDVLRGRSPQMIQKELLMYSIAYNLLRSMMQEAASMYEVSLSRISFKSTVQQFNQWLWLFMRPGLSLKQLRELKNEFYEKLVDRLVPERPGRNEPRARKRRQKNYNLLTKPRNEMVIDYHRNRPEKKNAFYPLS